ncbi:hypothetical protein SAY87_007195 [Trapa incisa]|uniref:Trichome birefringence-like N-terminal domain-containing protein n=1 Tax=Trapa incisa TaxID=236973 RepID=A0AAN7Q0G8_9MYRT|nr:hypothetical protein SAY87_007195 [Trapa incisa]
MHACREDEEEGHLSSSTFGLFDSSPLPTFSNERMRPSSTREDTPWSVNLGAVPPLLLFLVLSTIISLFILYSPNPNRLHLDPNPNPRPHHLGKDEAHEDCDLSEGRWVPDTRGPPYTNWSCRTIPESKDCFMHGRRDRDFLNWWWKPDKCELPRLDPKAFLEMVRGKTMAFIGDSVARNHMESLLCLLSQEETPLDVYKDSEDRFRTWLFSEHDFTLKVLWSKFLVAGEETTINGTLSGTFELRVDRVDEKWASELPRFDYAVISSGHWFFRKMYVYDGPGLVGCVYCSDPNVTSFGPEQALRLAMRTSFGHIARCEGCKPGLVTVLRTFSPAHFENGEWNTGGTCNRTGPQEHGPESGVWQRQFRDTQVEEMNRARATLGGRGRRRFEVVDVTVAMTMRPDGHPGEFWSKWMKGYSDCVHWCLPGPIDVWSDFLMWTLRRSGGRGH